MQKSPHEIGLATRGAAKALHFLGDDVAVAGG